MARIGSVLRSARVFYAFRTIESEMPAGEVHLDTAAKTLSVLVVHFQQHCQSVFVRKAMIFRSGVPSASAAQAAKESQTNQ